MRSRSAARSAPAAVVRELGVHPLGERAGREREDRDRDADHHDDQPQQVAGQPVGALLLPFGQQRGEDRHERGADGRVGEQLLHELRDHRDRDEGVVGGVDPVDGGGDDLAAQAGEAGDGRGGGDDDRREGELARVVAHESSDSTAGGRFSCPASPDSGRGAAGPTRPGRAARAAASLAEGGPASRPGRPYERTAGTGGGFGRSAGRAGRVAGPTAGRPAPAPPCASARARAAPWPRPPRAGCART